MSQQKEIGTLVVVVLKAQHLHQPSFYKQDPYAQVSLSGLKKRTKVDTKGGQHPVWDDEFRFPVLADAGSDKINRTLEVSCYKDEQRGDDVFLGKGTVDIEETLKTGEFDDWVSLSTSAGVRGEVYLELTFYANSPPPLTRRPSKLSPSDRLARPAAYFTQGRQSNPSSTSSSPQPVAGERKPTQLPPTQIPSSLVPAHGPQSQASRQAPSHENATSATSVDAAKHKDSLPPLPANNDSSGGKNPGLPAALHPGGRSGPRPIPPQKRNRETSTGLRPDQRHRTLSDRPALTPPLLFSQLQVPVQTYSTGIISVAGDRVGSTPSIVVVEHVEDHPPPAFPTPLVSSPMPTQEHEPRGVYATGNDSLAYGSPGWAYMQPNPQGHIPTESYSPTFSPPQRSMPLQSSHTSPGQPQQLYDVSPAVTTSPPLQQQFIQYSSGVPTSQPPPPQMYPQLHSSPQFQQQQAPYPPQLQHPLHQQHFFLPQQQYHPQRPPYTQTPHPPSVSQSYQQHTGAPHQQPYFQVAQRQPQSRFAAPPPPPVQTQTPQLYAPQPIAQSYLSPLPPPPPPPPPPLYNQAGKGPVSVAHTQVPPSALNEGQIPLTPLLQSVTPATPLLRLTTTPLPAHLVPNNVSTEEAARQGQVEERKNEDRLIAVAEMEPVQWEGVRETLQDAAGNTSKEETVKGQGQVVYLNDTKEQELREEKENQQFEEEVQQQGEDLHKQESRRQDDQQQQDVERRMREEDEHKQREEEHRRREDGERRRIEDEERRRREEEEQRVERTRREEECREREEEEYRRREQEELRRKEEERRKKEEEERRRQEEEEHRRREEERKRQEEEECRKREEEHRKQELIQREREEAECRRKAAEEARRRRAEEAEAERKWQEELTRIRARAEQEAADAAFARAQMEAEEAERQKQEEADLALVRQVQEEAEREERLARERRQQEEADMEVARREQAHEEELERRRQEEERRRQTEEADRKIARRLAWS